MPGPEQLAVGEIARLRNNRSMEGSSGLGRLTGQKAEPPWGVKFTLLGSGQEEMRAGLSWCSVLWKEKNPKGLVRPIEAMKHWCHQNASDAILQVLYQSYMNE